MNARRRRALLAAVGVMLESGEQVEATALVNLSEVSFRKNMAMGVAAAILSGGAMFAAAAPQPMYIAVTRERLFIFQANQAFAKPDRHLVTFQLKDVRRTEIKPEFLKKSFILVDESSEQALRIIFPWLVSCHDVDPVAQRIAVVSA